MTGTIARSPAAGGSSPRESSSRRIAPAVSGQDHVVDRAPERALELLDLGQRDRRDPEPALAADRDIEAGLGRGDDLVADDHLDQRPRRVQRLARPGGSSYQAKGSRDRSQREVRPARSGPADGTCAAPDQAGVGRRHGLHPPGGSPESGGRPARPRARSRASRRRRQRSRRRRPCSDGSWWPAPSGHSPAPRPERSPTGGGCDRGAGSRTRLPTRPAPGRRPARAGAPARRARRGQSPGALATRATPAPRCAARRAAGSSAAGRRGARRGAGRPAPAEARPVGPRVEDHDAADVHVGALVGLLQLEEGRVECSQLIRHHPARQVTSGIISIAPQGHSATQRPQPLQKSRSIS